MGHKTKKCPQCGGLFIFGVTGAAGIGKDKKCDACQGIERDAQGEAWMPWETSRTYRNVGDPLGNTYADSRPETHKRGRK